MSGDLDAKQEARATALHEASLVIDAHDNYGNFADLDGLASGRIGGQTCRCLMVYIDVKPWEGDGPEDFRRSAQNYGDGWFRDGMLALEAVLRNIDEHPDDYLLVQNAADVRDAKRTNRLGVLVALEGAKVIEGRLELLRLWHRLGLRMLGLSWTFGNEVENRGGTPASDLGLTDFGRDVIRECNRLGVIIDPSQSLDVTFNEVLEISTQPIVVSHSGSRVLRKGGANDQNLSDEMIEALADKGGVCAIHFMSHHLKGGATSSTIDDVIDVVDYLVDKGGIDVVAWGSDWFPKNAAYLQARGGDSFSFPVGLEDASRLPNATRALVRRGYSDDQIQKIIGGNLVRVFETVLV